MTFGRTAAAIALCVVSGWPGGVASGRGKTVEPPLVVHGSLATVEIAPVLLAGHDHQPRTIVHDGGIGTLLGLVGGIVDLATHAETQALRYSVKRPDLRIILTVTEGRYRIVARRSAGIATLADLRGRRIATLPGTSAEYFLSRMLSKAGLGQTGVSIVRVPIAELAGALARHEVDAVAIWEPYADAALLALGGDSITFADDRLYRERFNLNTTAANLADPNRRRRIVRFVRTLIDTAAAIRRDGRRARAEAVSAGGFTRATVNRSWATLSFPASLPGDLLDLLVTEELWLAAKDGRAPRSRATLAPLIDGSVLAEALSDREIRR